MISLRKLHFKDLLYFNFGYNKFVTPNECQVAIEDDVEAEVHEQRPVMQNVDKVDFIDLTLHPPSLIQKSNNTATEEKGTTTLNRSNNCLSNLFVHLFHLINYISRPS